jgi:hypothetical protein
MLGFLNFRPSLQNRAAFRPDIAAAASASTQHAQVRRTALT